MKINQYNAFTGKLRATLTLSKALAATIARFNENLTTNQVVLALTKGETIHTSFNFYSKT